MPDARGPALLRKQVEQRLRLVELAGLDGDIGQHGRREPEPRREVTFLQHAQRDPGRRVGLGQRAEPQLEQAQGGVGRDEAARRAGAVNLGQHRLQRLLDRGETLGRDQHPQQRRPRVPVLNPGPARASASSSRAAIWPAGPARQQHRHRLRDRERLTGRLGLTCGQAGEHGRDPRRAARVVKPADHQLALQPGRELLVGLAELRERPFDDIHRVHPPEQGRVRLGDLERDLGALPRIGGQPQRLLQQHARRFAPRARLRASRLTQNPGPLRGWRRFGQRPAQQTCRGLRCAAVHRRPRGLPQPRQYPAIAGRPHPDQMRGDLARRGPIGVQQPGRAAMGAVTLAAAQRRLKRIADNRMNEPRRVIGRQHLDPHQALSQPRGGGHLHARDRRRVPQLAAIPQHGERLSQAKRVRTQAPHPGDHPPRDPLQAPRQQLGRIQRGQRPAAGLGRPQQLGQVQRITAAGRIHSRAQLVARLAASHRTHDRAHAPSLSSAGRRTAAASARSASSGAPITAGSPGRNATSSPAASPSSRGAR